MNHNKRSFLKMGSLVLVLVLALTALVTTAGASRTSVPAQAPLNAPQAAIDNAATCTVAAGSVECNLYAKTGSLMLPGGATVDIWGYSDTSGGPAQLPGPTIIATEGDTVTVTLYNNLGQDTALLFPGQDMIPDLTGVPDGGSKVYTFTATNPGTYLYEAGLLPDAARQVAMGMFGALVVRPLSGANHAYDASSAFDDEALLVLSEIDPDLNANPAGFDMRDFVPQYRLINGKAYPETAEISTAAGNKVLLRYVNAGIQQHTMGVLGMDQLLIARDANLRPYPQRELAESIGPGRTADAIVTVPASAGTLGETHFALYDASLLLHNSGDSFGGMLTFLTVTDGTPPDTGPAIGQVTLAPNPTDENSNVEVSATAAVSGSMTAAEFYIDSTTGTAHTMTVSGDVATGEISTTDLATLDPGDHTIYVRGSNGTTWGAFNFAVLHLDKLGPTTSGITLTPNPSDGSVAVGVSATGNDAATGNSDVTAAEYFIDHNWELYNDATGGTFTLIVNGDPTGDIAFDAPATGIGSVEEALENLSSITDVIVTGVGIDTDPWLITIVDPITTLVPDDTNLVGGVNTIMQMPLIGMTVSPIAPITSLAGTIDTVTMAGLVEGAHTVYIHSMDEFGHWGDFAQAILTVDQTGPLTSNVVADPNPNNGSQPYNPSVNAVRVDATISDVSYTIQRAEGFINTIGADGSGFPLTPSDGLFNESVEDAYVYIPLSTIGQLGVGTHQIYIHGQDASGNWGTTDFVDFVIETDIPTVTNVAVTPNTTDGTVLVDLTATASDPSSGIDLAEWFTGPDPGTGNGTPMNVSFNGVDYDLSATVDASGWAPDNYQLNVRAMDAAGNWSPTAFTTLTVTAGPPTAPELLYFSTFGNGLVPGTASPYDDADVYLWDNGLAAFSRVFDARAGGANILPTNADIDGLAFDPNAGAGFPLGLYYISFRRSAGTNVPGVGVVQDEDVVTYDPENGEWQLYFAGANECDGMDATNGHNIDAFDIVGGITYFSTAGNAAISGVAGPYDDADIYSIDPVLGCIRVLDASTTGLDGTADIDGLTVVDADTFYISFDLDAGTFVPGLGLVPDESVVLYDAGAWSLYFDGTGQGLGADNNQDLDAIDVQ